MYSYLNHCKSVQTKLIGRSLYALLNDQLTTLTTRICTRTETCGKYIMTGNLCKIVICWYIFDLILTF